MTPAKVSLITMHGDGEDDLFKCLMISMILMIITMILMRTSLIHVTMITKVTARKM